MIAFVIIPDLVNMQNSFKQLHTDTDITSSRRTSGKLENTYCRRYITLPSTARLPHESLTP